MEYLIKLHRTLMSRRQISGEEAYCFLVKLFPSVALKRRMYCRGDKIEGLEDGQRPDDWEAWEPDSGEEANYTLTRRSSEAE